MTRRVVLALLLIAASTGAAAEPRTDCFYGYAYDLDSGRYLYTEVHRQTFEGERWLGGSIRYFAPDGREIGVKVLDFAANPFVPVYDYRLPALGYREAITAVGERITMQRTSGGRTRTASARNEPPVAADAGFDTFLRAHFEQLLEGRTVTFTFVAAGTLDTFKFRARRIEDAAFEGQSAVQFKVEADSLLRLVAPELFLTYHPETRRLLEYRGPSNVLDPKTEALYKTRIVYPAAPPADAPKNLPPLGS